MKGFLKTFLFFTFCTLSVLWAGAQSFFKTASFGMGGHYGSFLTTAPKAQYVKDSYSYFGEAYFQKTTIEGQPWGAGIFYGNTGSKYYIGNMGGAFGFVTVPIVQKQNFKSGLRIASGLGYVEKPYNKISNHKNVVIGSYLNSYINFTLQNEVKILKTLSAIAGVSFTHLSNGGTKMPNLGLNIPAITAGFKYGAESQGELKTSDQPVSKTFSFSFYTSAGVKQFPWIESKRYLVNVAQAEVQKNISNHNQLGVGLVLFYDRSNTVDPSGDPTIKREGNYLMAGVHASYQHAFGRLSIPIQLGAYVYNKDIYKTLFQQFGFRYQCTQKLSAQLLLKAHMGKADVLHAGIGYHLN